MAWPSVPLEQVAEIRGGATPRRNDPTYWNGDIPWLTPTDLPPVGEGITDVKKTADSITEKGLASSSSSLLPPGTVLFSSRASIGKIGIAAVPLATNQGFTNFIPRYGVEPRYLAWCLSFNVEQIAGLAGSTTFKEVSKKSLKLFRIPLPPISEQRRIVEFLDQADRIRRLRCEADKIADRILSAISLKIFGDPATNPKRWPERRIGQLCKVVSGATPKTNRSEYWGGNISWATPKDLSGLDEWILERTERTLTKEGLASCSATMIPKGSVLLSSRAPIGLVAISGVAICTNQGFKSLICGPGVDPWYLFAWCRLQTSFLQSLGRGATFKEVSKSIVDAIQIPVPPLAEQKQFRAILEKLRCVQNQARISGTRVCDLFRLLLSRAFTGHLTATWREDHIEELH